MNKHAANQPLLQLPNSFFETIQLSTYATSENFALQLIDDLCNRTMDQIVQNGLKSRVGPFSVKAVVY